jgi:predicted nucleic acid-binding protein
MVLDSSAVVDHLYGTGAASRVASLLAGATPAAPDVLVFEVLAVVRRDAARGIVSPERAGAVVDDLGDFAVDLFPSMALRRRAWELRENLTIADGLFVALAERLGEPLVTKDAGLAIAARKHAGIEVEVLA